jgi:uncharacterized membrane-anchored protein
MDTHKIFLIGIVLLALFVIVDATWVLVEPPAGDEVQAIGLIIIGIFMLFIGYHISKRKKS